MKKHARGLARGSWFAWLQSLAMGGAVGAMLNACIGALTLAVTAYEAAQFAKLAVKIIKAAVRRFA